MNKEEFINEFNDWTKEEILGRAFEICCKNIELKEIEKEHQRINGDLRVEIKELKEKYMKLEDKYIHNVACCNEEDCDLFSEHQELKKDIKNIIRILNKNCDDLEATEEEFESLERYE